MDKQTVAHPHTRILLSNKIDETCKNLDGSQRNYAKNRNQTEKATIVHESIYMTFWKGKTIGTEIDLQLLGAGGGGRARPNEVWGNLRRGERCLSVSLFCWWFYDCICLSKFIELYPKKG